MTTEINNDVDKAVIVRNIEQTLVDAYGAVTFEQALHVLALQARIMMGAHQCAISFIPGGDFVSASHTHSFSEKYDKYNTYDVMPTGEGIWGVIVENKTAVRMTQEELERHPRWRNFSDLKDDHGLEHPPMRGWLAVPIVRQNGEFIGVVQLSDKYDGDFTQDDQEVLIRLANMISPTFELQLVNNQLHDRTEALRQSQARLSQMSKVFLNGADPILLCELDGRVIDMNKEAERLYGWSRQELFGQPMHTLVPRERHAQADELLERCRRGENICNVESLRRTKFGEVIPVLLTYSLLTDEAGEPEAIATMATDISELKRAEERLRLAATGAGIGTWHWNTVSNELVWSDKCKSLFGIAANACMSYERFLEALHPEDRERAHQAVIHALDNRTEYSIEYRSLWPDGSVHWLAAKGHGFYNAEGQPTRMEGIVLDVSEQKRTREELEDHAERIHAILETAADAIIIIDERGNIDTFNPAAERMFGYAASDIIGQNVKVLMPQPYRSEHDGYLRNFLTTGDKKVIGIGREVVGMRKDGATFPLELGVSEVLGRDKRYFTGIVRDITDRKRAEEELARRATELQRSNQELEQFAYVASHDLQEPLRKVASFCQLLRQSCHDKLDEESNLYIDYAVDGALRMKNLVQDLLTYSRVGRHDLKLERIDVAAACEGAIGNLQAVIRESGARVTHESLPTSLANEAQMVRLLQNLIANAIKYRSDRPPQVHVKAASNGDEWVCSVQDNGIGIAPEYSERIFEIFQRLHTRGEYPGTGIGLAICKKIVERFGGRIWVESEPDRGSTFYFTIPFLDHGQGASIQKPRNDGPNVESLAKSH